jgi:hypothetical protein
MKRLRTLYRDVVAGLFHNIPPCCIARYALDVAINPKAMPAMARGLRSRVNGDLRWSGFVPCGVLHRSDPPLRVRSPHGTRDDRWPSGYPGTSKGCLRCGRVHLFADEICKDGRARDSEAT